jgi:diguanylate cyclase (GGDEF)-like protein
MDRLSQALVSLDRTHGQVALFFIDLDNFKTINDEHGHDMGDDVLVAASRRIEGMLRPVDTLARLSGDEFVIMCEDLGEESQANLIGHRILEALAIPFPGVGFDVQLTASIGIAFADPANQDPKWLLRQADSAMYQVKRKGGRNVEIIDNCERTPAGHPAGKSRVRPVRMPRVPARSSEALNPGPKPLA